MCSHRRCLLIWGDAGFLIVWLFVILRLGKEKLDWTTKMTVAKDDCCGHVHCIKCLLTIINLLLLVRAASLVGAGVWTLLDNFDYVYLLLTYVTYTVLVYTIIAAGTLLFITCIIGFISVHRSHKICLVIYIFLLSLILVLCGVLSVSFYVYRENIDDELQMNLNSTMLMEYKVDDYVTVGVDSLQSKFKCCGSDSYTDWQYSPWLVNNMKNLVPDSCCKTVTLNCGISDHPSNIYYASCRKKMEMHMKLHILTLCLTSCCFVEILGIIFACWLYFKLRSETLNISEARPLYQDRTL